MTEKDNAPQIDLDDLAENEKYLGEVSEAIDRSVAAAVYQKGAKGRFTRILLSGIKGLQVNKAGRGLTTLLGLKKLLRKNTGNVIAKDTLDVAQNWKETRKWDRKEAAMGMVPGTDNAANVHRNTLAQERKVLADAAAYSMRENLIENDEEVIAPSTIKKLEQQRAWEQKLAETDPKNIYRIITAPGHFQTVIQEEDNLWTIEDVKEMSHRYVNETPEDRALLRAEYDKAEMTTEEFKGLSEDDQQLYLALQRNRKDMQYLIDNAETIDVAMTQAEDIFNRKPGAEDQEIVAPMLTDVFIENLAASTKLENVRMIPSHLAAYLHQDLEADPDANLKAAARLKGEKTQESASKLGADPIVIDMASDQITQPIELSIEPTVVGTAQAAEIELPKKSRISVTMPKDTQESVISVEGEEQKIEEKNTSVTETQSEPVLSLQERLSLIHQQIAEQEKEEETVDFNSLDLQGKLAFVRKQIAEQNPIVEQNEAETAEKPLTTEEIIARAAKNGVHVELPKGYGQKSEKAETEEKSSDELDARMAAPMPDLSDDLVRVNAAEEEQLLVMHQQNNADVTAKGNPNDSRIKVTYVNNRGELTNNVNVNITVGGSLAKKYYSYSISTT